MAQGLRDIPLDDFDGAVPSAAYIAREQARIDALEHRPNAQRQYCADRDAVFRDMQLIEAEPDTDATWTIVPAADSTRDHVRVHRHARRSGLYRLNTGHCRASAKVVAGIIVNNPATVRLLWNGAQVKHCRQLEAFPEANLQIVDLVVRPDWWSMVTPRRLLGLFWHRDDPAKRTNLFIWKSTGHRSLIATHDVGGGGAASNVAKGERALITATGWYGIFIRAVGDEMCDVTIYAELDYHPSLGTTDALVVARLRNCIAEWEGFAKFKQEDSAVFE